MNPKKRLGAALVVMAGWVLAGCGGAEPAAPAPLTLMTIQAAVSRATADTGGTPLPPPPLVVNLEKVSETRVSRTVFEYKFRIIARSGEVNYKSGEFTVTAAGAGTTIVAGSAKIGQIAGGDYVRSDGTLTLRHDRQLPFDMAALKYSFAGEVLATVSPGSTVSILSVDLLKQGGRPGHGGALTLSTEHPLAGDLLELRAKVGGSATSVVFAFADANGVPTGNVQALQRVDESDTYLANLTVPAIANKIVVTAAGPTGDRATWTTKTFSPQQMTFSVELPNAVFAHSQTRLGSIISTPAPQAGQYLLTMTLPDGFQSSTTNWRVSLRAGESANIPVTIVAPTTGRISGKRIFVSWVNASNAAATTFSSTRILLY